MPEYIGSDIPTNDSHLIGGKKLSRADNLASTRVTAVTKSENVSRFMSARAAFFLLFWVLVALTVLIYWKWSRSDGVHYAESIGQEVRSTPVKEKTETKKSVSYRAMDKKPLLLAQKAQGHLEKTQAAKSYSNQSTFAKKNYQKKTLSQDTDRSKKVRQAKRVKKEKKSIRKSMNASATVKNVRELRTKAAKLARQKEWAKAARLAEQVVYKYPHTLKDMRFLGLCLLVDRQYQRGIYELERILRYGHSDAVVEHYLGFAYYKVGSFDKALSAYERAIRMDPANPRHYKSGAQLIVEVCKIQPGFNRCLPLAKTWYERAIALGTDPSKLANVKRVLELNGHLALRTN